MKLFRFFFWFLFVGDIFSIYDSVSPSHDHGLMRMIVCLVMMLNAFSILQILNSLSYKPSSMKPNVEELKVLAAKGIIYE